MARIHLPRETLVLSFLFRTCLLFVMAADVSIKAAAREKCAAPVKVAVIGGGITGAATTTFLKQLAGATSLCQARQSGDHAGPQTPCSSALHIDVIESNKRLGGRLDHVYVSGGHVELGGDSIVRYNRYMREFQLMYLSDAIERLMKGTYTAATDRLAAYDNNAEIDWGGRKLFLNGRRIQRWKALFAQPLISLALNSAGSWSKLYDVFDNNAPRRTLFRNRPQLLNSQRVAFKSGFDMVESVGLSRWTRLRLSALMHRRVLPFARALIEFLVRNIYTQEVTMQSLAGLIALVGTFGTKMPTAMPFRTVVESLINQFADSVYLNCKVDEVIQKTNVDPGNVHAYAYVIKTGECEPLASRQESDRTYNFVVVAAPLSPALPITRETEHGRVSAVISPYYEYQKVFVTVVQAGKSKNPLLVNVDSNIVLTNDQASFGPFFASFCGRGMVEGQQKYVICKIKTGKELSDGQVAALFEDVSVLERRTWNAYPYMYPFSDDENLDTSTYSKMATTFELLSGLFYPNAFEGLFSCMEGQAIAARNVAHLIMNSLNSGIEGDAGRDAERLASKSLQTSV